MPVQCPYATSNCLFFIYIIGLETWKLNYEEDDDRDFSIRRLAK